MVEVMEILWRSVKATGNLWSLGLALGIVIVPEHPQMIRPKAFGVRQMHLNLFFFGLVYRKDICEWSSTLPGVSVPLPPSTFLFFGVAISSALKTVCGDSVERRAAINHNAVH
jgi:hypothetical protein